MVEIKIKDFPTHVAKTNNKVAANKYWKINNQSIYNGSINTFSRAIVIENLHDFIISVLPDYKLTDFPIKVDVVIKTVKNHGNIRRLKSGKISWKPPEKDFIPTWDEDNLTAIWTKVIRDSLTKKGIIPDDNVKYIIGGYRGIEFVNDIKDREIIIKLERV